MDKEKLAQILDLHKKWLNGDKDGKRANLVGANMDGAKLVGANLVGANLRGAYLFGANLSGATINWNSHDLIAEIIRRASGDQKRQRTPQVRRLLFRPRHGCTAGAGWTGAGVVGMAVGVGSRFCAASVTTNLTASDCDRRKHSASLAIMRRSFALHRKVNLSCLIKNLLRCFACTSKEIIIFLCCLCNYKSREFCSYFSRQTLIACCAH